MSFSPSVERWEILLPSLDIVHGHSVQGEVTTSDDHSVRIRDGTGIAVINTVKTE